MRSSPVTRPTFRLAAIALLTCAGCGSNKLETGYAYTPLSSTPTQRRAYYAGPFSPEARDAAQQEAPAAAPERRSRPGA